ncbi:MAG: YceI family protein [Pseudomonadota bacterium]
MRTLLSAFAAAALLALQPVAAAASSWTVVSEESRIGFSGTHAGNTFSGQFKEWTAEITLDPEALDQAKAVVTVELTSAETGNVTYDKSLPSADWFNTGAKATAVYRTEEIKRAENGNGYVADGTLELRDVKLPVTLTFDLDIEGDTATMTGKSTIARLDYGIGKASDAKGAWVSLDIPVDIKVVAKRAN